MSNTGHERRRWRNQGGSANEMEAMESFIGAPKPRRPDLHLELGEQASTLTLEIKHIDRTMPLTSAAQAEKWKNHAVKQIKRFAHSEKTVEIQVYVEQHFRIGGGSALSWPVSVFGLISDGIKYFSK
jgi:hypothetical protein